jgi:hypothetical protein
MKCACGTNAWGRAASISAARRALGAGGMARLLGRGALGVGGTARLLGRGVLGAGGTAWLLGHGADGWGTFRFGVADIGWGRPL